MWKAGQIVTIDNKIYRVTKADMHQGAPSVCSQCREANSNFRKHDEDSCCPSYELKWKCIVYLRYNCYLKPIN